MSVSFGIYLGILTAGAIIGWVRSEHLSRPFRILWVLIIYSLFSESMSRVFIRDFGMATPIYHIYAVVSFMLYSWFYYEFLHKYKFLRYLIIIGIALSIPAGILNAVFFQKLTYVPSNTLTPSFVIFSFYSIVTFYYLLQNPTETSVFRNPYFWFAAGTILYSAASFLYLGFDGIIFRKLSDDRKLLISQIHFFFPMLMYAFYGVSLALDTKPKSE